VGDAPGSRSRIGGPDFHGMNKCGPFVDCEVLVYILRDVDTEVLVYILRGADTRSAVFVDGSTEQHNRNSVLLNVIVAEPRWG
jgi:hypothetical protein